MIKRDVNKSLVVLNIYLLILLAGSTIFYETKLRNALNDYNKKMGLYGDISTLPTANVVLEELNKTSSLKDAAIKDKLNLEKKYLDLLEQNENLENNIESLKSEITLLKSQEEYQKSRDGGPVAQFRLIQNKNTEINKLKEEIGKLCLTINSYNLTAKEC
ncbi:hypothetical protein HYY70_00040 [Candidatus Woesearchaeota archaeon]|nr:hypothetical protein [Candidatus Woesearchaeota archaeon]